MIDRRALLTGAAGAVAALTFPLSRAQSLSAEPWIAAPVAGDFTVLSGGGGNVLVRANSGGQILVDTGAAEHADALLVALEKLPGAGSVYTVFNTHWHLDQIGANERLGRAGAGIVAHEKTRQHIATAYYLPIEDRYQVPLPPNAHPKTTFFDRGELAVDDELVEYGYLLEAHTDGDIYVHFRNANIIAAGDVVSPELDPTLDWFGGGWLGGRVDSLQLLLDISDDQTKFVPSYGPVVGREYIQAEHALMLELFERMVDLVRKGESAEDIVAGGIMDGLDREFQDPLRFVYDAHKGLWAHHNTLSPDVV